MSEMEQNEGAACIDIRFEKIAKYPRRVNQPNKETLSIPMFEPCWMQVDQSERFLFFYF